MDIGLVSSVKNQGIRWRTKHPMHSEGDLDYAKIWSQVATGLRDGFDEERADLLG